jgi:hypothetical protein
VNNPIENRRSRLRVGDGIEDGQDVSHQARQPPEFGIGESRV